jgi:hypothetical protein
VTNWAKILSYYYIKLLWIYLFQGTIVLHTTRNRPKIMTFVKYFSKIFDIIFHIQLDELYPTIKKKNFAKIFSYGHITYIINALKFEYIRPDNPSAAHILNSLASQRMWLFSPYTVVNLVWHDSKVNVESHGEKDTQKYRYSCFRIPILLYTDLVENSTMYVYLSTIKAEWDIQEIKIVLSYYILFWFYWIEN